MNELEVMDIKIHAKRNAEFQVVTVYEMTYWPPGGMVSTSSVSPYAYIFQPVNDMMMEYIMKLPLKSAILNKKYNQSNKGMNQLVSRGEDPEVDNGIVRALAKRILQNNLGPLINYNYTEDIKL